MDKNEKKIEYLVRKFLHEFYLNIQTLIIKKAKFIYITLTN